MAAQYDPDDSALPTPPWTAVYLSNRDLVAQVPINFVTHPGVSITAACFGNGTYSAASAWKCISNLLGAQYRRLVLDIYWDPLRRQFGFCPVAVPTVMESTREPTSTPSPAATPAPISTVRLSRSSTSTGTRVGRQTLNPSSSSSFSSSSSINASLTISSTMSQLPVVTATGSSGETVYELGPYQCSQNLSLDNFNTVILEYFRNTSDTIQARLLFIEYNLHAAASSNTPNEPAEAPSEQDLPNPSELVGSQFNSTMQGYIYKASELVSDRGDLNSSWLDQQTSEIPIAAYLTTTKLPNGVYATSDGWPCEIYVLDSKYMRLLVGWRTVDPQMANYNFTGDGGTMFPPGYLSDPRLIGTNGKGEVTAGCLFDPGKTSVSQVNSSWALSDLVQDSPVILSPLSNNLTSCGISPILNEALSNSTAGDNVAPYVSIARSAVWSWAPGEPRNASALGSDDHNSQSQFRCALMDTSSAYLGHWRVEDCPNKYRAACRVNYHPYIWNLSDNEVSFANAPDSCPSNTTFAVPLTGLENAYLYHQVLAGPTQVDPNGEGATGIWINFNSLDIETCWVATGPDGTCPYYADKEEEQRTVLIPTIAAIIVLVLTALTMFVKCNVNRRNARTRKRGVGGWDYEGVPS